jgi:hypothetical protein
MRLLKNPIRVWPLPDQKERWLQSTATMQNRVNPAHPQAQKNRPKAALVARQGFRPGR